MLVTAAAWPSSHFPPQPFMNISLAPVLNTTWSELFRSVLKGFSMVSSKRSRFLRVWGFKWSGGVRLRWQVGWNVEKWIFILSSGDDNYDQLTSSVTLETILSKPSRRLVLKSSHWQNSSERRQVELHQLFTALLF